jgi:transcriptional regulator with XRE-family HTH domain
MEGKTLPLEVLAGQLRKLRAHHGMRQRPFAEWLGLPATTYHEYENQKRQPLLAPVVLILRRTGVSADWLLLGQGPMFVPKSVSGVLAELREKTGRSAKETAQAGEIPLERYIAFEQGSELPDLAADFQALVLALDCDPLSRQRLFDAIEKEFQPQVLRSLAQEKDDDAPKTGRFGKFLEPWQLRRLLDRDEETFSFYQAQPIARKAALVMTILKNSIEDPETIKAMIYDNFSEIQTLNQVKTLMKSDRRNELVSYIRFLIHEE